MLTKEVCDVMFKEYPDVMDVKQFSAAVGISERTAYKLLKTEQIPAIRMGRQYRIAKVNVIAYLEVFSSNFEKNAEN